ncbi:hypothetical protein [Yeosuana marina]|uniref:hypothetical protein n=1 Tax=Yeosuana marina TaxID=1565536 RepID=UPI0030EEF132|tara:strand:- start:289 stop:777 length:489 start_codon:yes stop_codon:yes gene_type:complete
METTEKSKQSKFSFINRYEWSKNRFAWFYAILILLASVTLGVIFKKAGIYESLAIRSINIFFIMIAFFMLIWDYKRSKHENIKFSDAFLLCARTGFYYCLLYLPVILIFLTESHSELQLVKTDETFNNNFSVIAIVFSTYVETVATVVILGILAAFTGNMKK